MKGRCIMAKVNRSYVAQGNYLYYTVKDVKQVSVEILGNTDYEIKQKGNTVFIRVKLNCLSWEKSVRRLIIDEQIKILDGLFGA